jgi:TM2 domain-containing membrane protein YozV
MANVPPQSMNPVVPLLLNVFVLAGLGDIVLGQTKKGLTVLAFCLAGVCLCCLPGFLLVILSHIDVYMCATALQRGEPLDENEYKLELLYKIVSLVDKTAVYRG